MTTSVGKKLVVSAGWSIAGDLLTALAGAASLIIAARLIPKAEIGLVAIVMLMLALIETLTTSGVEQALVQRPEDDVSALLDAAWTWQLGRGVVIAACMLAAAPLIARFYGEPRLAELACALAILPALRGATNIALVLKLRELDFRAAFAMNAAPALLRLAAVIPLSLMWRNAWALVAVTLGEHALRLALSYGLAPRRPGLRPRWSEIAPLLRYGRWVTGLSILTYLTTRGDDVFVSKYFGTAELALYQLAYGVANVPVTAVTHVLGRVTFPAYARLHGQAGGVRAAFLEVLRTTTLAAFVTSVVLYFALPFLPVLVGPQWRDAVGIGQVLTVAGAVRALVATGGPLFQGTGRPDLDVRMNAPRLLALLSLLLPLAAFWGLPGVSWASLASICACLPVWIYGARAQAGLRVMEIAGVLRSSVLAGALAAAVFGTLAALMPRDVLGLCAFASLGLLATYLALRAGERLFGLVLLPSLHRIKAL